MIDQRKRIFAVSLWLLDLLLTMISFFLAYRLRLLFPIPGYTVMKVQVYLWLLVIILPTWAIILPLFRVYSDPAMLPLDQILRLTRAIVFAWLVVATLSFFVDSAASSRLMIFFTLGINYCLLISYRVLLLKLKRHSALDVRHVAVAGNGPAAQDFGNRIEAHLDWGLKLIGVVAPKDVRALLETGGVDELIIVADKENLDEFNETFLLCEETGITARVVLNFFPHSFSRMELLRFDGLPLLSFSTTPTNEVLMILKRIMDICVAFMVALVTLPVTLISAILIRLTSPGPVLFKQERCGLNRRPFTMYKLRSMVDNAEQARYELEVLNEMDGPVFKSSKDPRITKLGRYLRRFSIDEFPQLYNVLRGDMSLVGPRPPLPQEVARYERWQRRRLSMKPGLTCLWQISGRNEVSFQDWMKLDLSYIDNWSLLLDLKILLKTIPVVLFGKGAK
jgi:exopolysaccharide biosynthesis polyprenyl glycosylphosphotransferase